MHCPRGAQTDYIETQKFIEDAVNCKVAPLKPLDQNPHLDQILKDDELRLGIYKFCDGVLFLHIDDGPDDWLLLQLDMFQVDGERLSNGKRLRGLVLDRAGQAEAATQFYEDVMVIPWRTEPDPESVASWLRGEDI
jgi:hypothetical protein